ncbi:zinc finger protein 12-like [Pseudophryne corroboree]|uniref:zinc finger protein 12-like n=1 Tax=Pseudophryne corroboree TaxID=495146 RepID=UPI0030817628
MEKYRNEMTERILNLTLEIIYLLTGEAYTIVNETTGERVTPRIHPSVSEGQTRTQSPIMVPPPHSMIHDRDNEQKILELTNKIIQLLTGEVPKRCQDVTVYFSTEEWEYIEGHRDLYKDVINENQETLSSPKVRINYEAEYTSSHIKEELVSSDGDLTDTDMYTPTGHTQYTSTLIKEEPVSCDGGDLTDTDNYTPTDCTQYTATHIKEEPVSCDGGDLTHTDMYTPTDHTQYTSTHIMEISDKGKCTDTSITGHIITAQTVEKNLDNTLNEIEIIYQNPAPSTIGDISYLTEYQRAHSKKKIPQCSECGEYFLRKDQLAAHQRTHTRQNLYECSESGKSWPDKAKLVVHKRSHTEEKLLPCPDCGKRFLCNSHLVIHQKTHTGEKPFESSQCGKITASDTSTDCTETKCSSNEAEHAQKVYKREQICQKYPLLYKGNIDADVYALIKHAHTKYSFTRIEGFTANEDERVPYTDMYTPTDHPLCTSTHTTEEPVSCDGGDLTHTDMYTPTYRAPYTFNHVKEISDKVKCTDASIDLVTGHVITAQTVEKNLDNTLNESKIIHQNPAPSTFGDISNLTKYQRAHSKKKTPQCSECGEYFLRKDQLAAHQRTHNRQNLNEHSERRKCWPDNGKIVIHKGIHTEGKLFPCPDCGNRFLCSSHLVI